MTCRVAQRQQMSRNEPASVTRAVVVCAPTHSSTTRGTTSPPRRGAPPHDHPSLSPGAPYGSPRCPPRAHRPGFVGTQSKYRPWSRHMESLARCRTETCPAQVTTHLAAHVIVGSGGAADEHRRDRGRVIPSRPGYHPRNPGSGCLPRPLPRATRHRPEGGRGGRIRTDDLVLPKHVR